MPDAPVPDVAEIESILNDRIPGLDPEIAGPVQVEMAAPIGDGLIACEATATRLVSLPESQGLGDVAVPVPVRLRLRLTAEGEIVELAAEETDADARQQAQAYAQMLVVRGAVRGAPRQGAMRGPAPRPTHEVTTDQFGRRVLRRVGIDAGGGVADGDKNL
jgi:hypothetical protein